MKTRDPLSVVLFTILTCGIYGIFWIVVTTEETNNEINDSWKPSPILVLVFSVLTVGIYYVYWYIKMAIRAYERSGNSPVLFVLVSIFTFGVIGYGMMQSNLNNPK